MKKLADIRPNSYRQTVRFFGSMWDPVADRGSGRELERIDTYFRITL